MGMVSAEETEQVRKWRGADGKYVFSAVLVGTYGDVIDLRREDGVTLRLPKQLLSQEDQTFLDPSSPASFEIEDLGHISTPEGYQWNLVRRLNTDKGMLVVYACTSSDSNSVLTLTVSPQVAHNQAERTAHLKGHFNGMIQGLVNNGVSISDAVRPELTEAIPDSVDYSLTGIQADGSSISAAGTTLFNADKTILLQSMGNNAAEVEKLAALSNSIQMR